MNVILDVVSPMFVLEETVLRLLPFLLIVLLLIVSIVVICLVLKKNKTQPPQMTESSEDGVCND